MNRRRTPALAGLALSCLLAPVVLAAQPWTVEPVASPAGAPFDLKAPDGRLRLLFPGGTAGRVQYAVSEDGGLSWSIEEISEGVASAGGFDVTYASSGRAITHAAFDGDGLVYATDADGTAFVRVALDAAAEAGEGGVSVATQAETVGVLYHKDGAVWLLRSADAGSTWDPARRLADAAPGFLSLAIAPSGALHALYASPGRRGPLLASSTDDGESWSTAVVADEALLSGSGRLLALDGGLIVAAYGAASGVHAARSSDGGTSWIASRIADGELASLALDPWGTFEVAYLAGSGGAERSLRLAYSVDLRSWTRETVTPVAGSGAVRPVLATTGRADYVVFGGAGDELLLAWNGGPPEPPAFVDVLGDSTVSDVTLYGRVEEQWYDRVDDSWYFRYQFAYRNAGPLNATGMLINVDLPEGTETVEGYSLPSLSTERNPTAISFRPGTLVRRFQGRAWLVARLPGPALPGTELVLEAEATNDTTENNPDDNLLTIHHSVPVLTPLVGHPALGGQTCRDRVAIAGLAQRATTVTVLLDGDLVAELTPDADGAWSAGSAALSPGDHLVSVRASAAGLESPSYELLLTADPSLAADPLDIVVDDEDGRRQRLQDGSGRSTLEEGWAGLRFSPGRTYRLGLASCCPTDPSIQEWSLALGGDAAALAMDYNPASGRFESDLAIPALVDPGVRLPLAVSYRCSPSDPPATLVSTGTAFGPLVDLTRVYDSSFGQGIGAPLAGITATLWQAVPAADLGGVESLAWVTWPAEIFGTAPNPYLTAADGYAPFFPPPGRYRWTGRDETGSYETYGAPSLVSTGGAIDPLVPLSEDDFLTRRIYLSRDPVEGRVNISRDEVVEWLNADTRSHRIVSLVDPALGTGGWDSGEIPPGGRYRRHFAELEQYGWTDTVAGGEALLVVRELIVSPEAGTQGTTLTITDEGFENKKGSVLVGSTPCKVQNWSDTEIVCLIKNEVPPPGLYDVTVTLKSGEHKVYTEAFEARSPTIRSISPDSGPKKTKVRILGDYWGTKKGTVTIGGEKAKVSRWVMGTLSGDSAIDAKVPKLDPGTYDVVVDAPTGTVTLVGGFTVE